MKTKKIAERLEYLRGELRAERISYGELAELQSLDKHIKPGDVELLEAAGVLEHPATQPTPGPWAWQKFGKEWCLTGQHGMRPIVLAVRKRALTSLVNGLLVPLDPQHPDARLIAAAPELVKALDAMLAIDDWTDDHIAPRETIDRAYAAIRKAKGES